MNNLLIPCDVGEISDGYHTFNELYEHRMVLFIALMNSYPEISWKSYKHNDGSMFDGGWFIAGMDLNNNGVDIITYHIKIEYWDLAKIPVVEFAPPWDGHISSDVIKRISDWIYLGRNKSPHKK